MALKTLIGAILAILMGPLVLNAQTILFSEDFESDLSQWVGKGGGPHSGVIAIDPLNPPNKVVTFTQITGSGDIFGLEFPVIQSAIYVLHFDYLGLPMEGSVFGNLGGFAGWAQDDIPTLGIWLAGTILVSGASVELLDDGLWHTYAISFNPFATFVPSNNTIRVRFEDFEGSQGIPGDAFFDNIHVEELRPVPIKLSTWGAIKSFYGSN